MAEKFKLQAVLKYRKTLEEQAQQKLAELLSAESALKLKQEKTELQLKTLSAQVLQKHQQGLSILDLQLYEDQIGHLRHQQVRIQKQYAELDELLTESRHALLVAARERKIIEKLKEKQLAEYLNQLDRKERIMLDEISLRQNGGLE